MRSVSSSQTQIASSGMEHPLRTASVSAQRLPTNTTTRLHAVHRWFNFIAGFSPELVARHCPDAPQSLLLDPFAGCGTSLVVAQSLGLRSVGFEPHPFFVRIARAKTEAAATEQRLAQIESALVEGLNSPVEVATLSEAAAKFLSKLFDLGTLESLLGSRNCIQRSGLGEDDLAFLLLSRVVEMCSKAKTDGIYKAPTSAKKAAAPLDAVREVLREVRMDTGERPVGGLSPSAEVHCASSEDMSAVASGSAAVVFTSPPYLNNFDFAEMTRMHLYFWGMCDSWGEITRKVRSRLIINTTTALAGHRDNQSEYRERTPAGLQIALDGIRTALRNERRVRAGNKEYDLLLFPYFAQMAAVLREAQRCLAADGKIHMIVADAAFYGVHVSTPQFLANAMSEMGFASVECNKLRDRGHRWILDKRDGSPLGLGEYHVVGQRRPAP